MHYSVTQLDAACFSKMKNQKQIAIRLHHQESFTYHWIPVELKFPNSNFQQLSIQLISTAQKQIGNDLLPKIYLITWNLLE